MSRSPHIDQPLSGWGRFPVESCHLYRPEKRRDVAAILESGAEPSYIARGLGRSYGDAALNRGQGAVSFSRLNRFLAFDPAIGTLECEAGVSFAEILETFLPRGFFPSVTPGTKFVTVGGAIAADIHGKNHHRDGSIANFVSEIRLLAPEGDRTCSPAAHPDVFWATVGGMGLTGMILSAKLRLARVASAYVLADCQKARNLHEAVELMAATDERFQYSVAWIDCLARGDSLGRGLLMRANHAAAGELSHEIRNPLELPKRARLRVPFDLPSFALNRASMGAFNTLYYAGHKSVSRQLVDIERFFYPLDRVQNWNRLYGKRGFVQYQVALPRDGGQEALKLLVGRLSDSGRGSFLAVLKRLGARDAGLLSFPIEGYTLALDIPIARDVPSFLRGLDEIVQGYHGRVYLAKDAMLRRNTFAVMYPRLDEFRALKARLDPKGVISSSLARRVGIIDG